MTEIHCALQGTGKITEKIAPNFHSAVGSPAKTVLKPAVAFNTDIPENTSSSKQNSDENSNRQNKEKITKTVETQL